MPERGSVVRPWSAGSLGPSVDAVVDDVVVGVALQDLFDCAPVLLRDGVGHFRGADDFHADVAEVRVVFLFFV